MSLLGLDIGTTGCKAIAFSEDGVELASSYREYPLEHPQQGWSELSPVLIWDNVCTVLREVNSRVTHDPVKALSISAQGEAVLPIDRDGRAIYNFIITFDARTQPQFEWWNENLGAERIFQITGMPLHPMYSINKIMWLKSNEPDIYRRAWKFLCVEDYIIYRLCGEPATDPSLAARTMAFDVTARDWSETILERAGVDRSLLPTVHTSGTGVGTVGEKVAGEVGFTPGVLVVTGGHDQPCGALGAGIVRPGMAMNATGTSDVICPAMPEPVLNDAMLSSNFCCYPHTTEGACCSIGFNLTGGLLLKWYRDTLCAGEVAEAGARGCDPYDVILSGMATEPATAFFLPHFVGAGTPHLNPLSRGALVGLTLETDKAQLTRAVIDSINYEMKLNIDRMEEAGIEISELRSIGGGAKSATWLQMKADVFGKPVTSLETSEAASLGTAILAGKALGIFSSAREAADLLVRTRATYEPNMRLHEQYRGLYSHYIKIYDLLSDFNRDLCSFTRERNGD